MDHEPLVIAENVSKKFCKSLKRSLFYGARDILRAVNPLTANQQRSTGGNSQISLRKDEFWALQNVSFELRRGDCLGLIGHNGAGKSTLLKVLNSLIKPDSGQIIMRGRVCALIELSAGFNPILTGRENIYNQGALLGLTTRDINRKLEEIIDFAELREFIDMPVQNYSSGMRVRLGFAVAVQVEPDVLLLDEVLAVGDTAFRFKCLNAMSNLLNRSAVIFVSHSMSQIQRVCTHVAMMRRGQIAYYGPDLQRGIEEYHQEIKKPELVKGSGNVALQSTKVTNLNNGQSHENEITVGQGESLEFELILQNLQGQASCDMTLVIWNMDMYPIATILSPERCPHRLDFQGKSLLRATMRFEDIPLAAGKYTLSLHSSDSDAITNHVKFDNVFSVNVSGHLAGQSSFLIRTQAKSEAL